MLLAINNGSKCWLNETSKGHLLQSLPENSNFPYTTLLLNDFDFDLHLQRLNYLPSTPISAEAFRVGLQLARDEFPGQNVRVMAVNRDGQLTILAETIPEPSRRPAPVTVRLELCERLPRPAPEFKTTAWLQERERKFPIPAGRDEVVLGLEGEEEVLEGLSSNFWVLKGKGPVEGYDMAGLMVFL